ncbi:MAG: hypothetical protein K2K74_19820 [Lachnospiraceae bacterium]|nr:hypothetical protein [Lachnospiraceae bacterium]
MERKMTAAWSAAVIYKAWSMTLFWNSSIFAMISFLKSTISFGSSPRRKSVYYT